MVDNQIVGLDIGTASTRAVLGEFNEHDELEIVGVGVAPSTGLRRGLVLNIEATLASVASAIEAAEQMSGRAIKSCIVGIPSANIESLNSRGVVAVTGKGREITRDDINRVIEAAQAVVIPMDREVLHVIPQSYIVDEQRGVRDPEDMIGVRLEAEVHIITGVTTTTQNLYKCVNRAGYKVERSMLGTLGAARSVLSTDEKELGCLLMDMGGGTTDLMVFSEGSPVFTSAVPAGGMQVTNDISIMLSVPMEAAERIKRESASCWAASVDQEELIIVPGIGGRAPAEVARRKLCTIVQPRMEEILRMARDKVEKMGYWKLIKAGVVLSGGAALMPGVAELAQSIFGLPVRVGRPPAVGGLENEYRNPQYAAAVGLVLLQADAEIGQPHTNASKRGMRAEKSSRAPFGRLLHWLKNGFF